MQVAKTCCSRQKRKAPNKSTSCTRLLLHVEKIPFSSGRRKLPSVRENDSALENDTLLARGVEEKHTGTKGKHSTIFPLLENLHEISQFDQFGRSSETDSVACVCATCGTTPGLHQRGTGPGKASGPEASSVSLQRSINITLSFV